MDLLVTNARIVTSRGLERGSIAIDAGEIVAVGAPGESYEDPQTVIDADGAVALPGALDIHTHMHDPGLFPEGIDFASQTESAVAGGVTTVVELPTQTPITTPQALEAKRAAGERLSHIDFALVAGSVQQSDIDIDVEAFRKAGVPDFKVFTAAPYQADDDTILELMARVRDAGGGSVRAHCENQSILDRARAAIESDEPTAYPASRPLEAELEAISRMGWFAESTGCPLHVVHISSGSGAAVGAQFKSRANVPVTLETCPQYLAFSTDDVADLGPFLKVNPALRSPAEVKRLWQALADGTIDLVATDHFPTYRAERERGWDDIWEPYAGLPGVETMLEYLISEGVHEGRLSWLRLRELVCTRPAQVAGVYPQKGSLAVGTDADIVLIREEAYELSADELTFCGGWTPFEGRSWSARVETVIADGAVAARNHEVCASPGDGSYLSR